MPPERKLDLSTAQWTIQALGRLALTFAMVVGVLIIIGGDERFGGRSYANALTYPGAPESWGWAVLIIGALGMLFSLVGRPHQVWYCLFLLSVWSGFFAFSFATTAFLDPKSSTTGAAVYTYVALSTLILGVAHRRGSRN